jgi:hypothetical protein
VTIWLDIGQCKKGKICYEVLGDLRAIPHMKNKKMHWGVLAPAALIVLLLSAYVLPHMQKPKARASRISAVNHVASVSARIPSTNALPVVSTNQ